MFLMILTGGFDGFEGCIINDRRFCLLKTLLSGNFPPTRRIPYQRIWDCAVKNCEVHLPQTPVLLKQKLIVYKIA